MEFKLLSNDSLPTMQTEINYHFNQGWKCENRPMIQQIMISKSKKTRTSRLRTQI